ncbi:MAG: type III secretion inner membrane ring lipoprotein SctJ [Verrucomicrobiota bacterium]|nr:type III secretion inner membrane ring lipoprotein SctJ [Verrucomicrobiota bacterium]
MRKYFLLLILGLLAACSTNHSIVSNIDEREANEIIVYLASKGIAAQKVHAASTQVGGGGPSNMYNINVDSSRATDAMAMLNRVGLPRIQGTTLLDLFAKSGLMSTDREESIRYQAGLAEELKNTIRKIDGVLDADVQISFPMQEATATPGAVVPKTTASVYIKHQGILEDPNSHLETKIRRLVSSSITGLNFEDVSVISDRARLSDIQLGMDGEMIGPKGMNDTYVKIWSIVMTKSSLGKFWFIFFTLILLNLLFAGALGWMIYKFYPQLLKKQAETPPTT